MFTLLVACGTDPSPGPSLDTDATGSSGGGASTGAPAIDLGPCAQLLPCVEATIGVSGAPFDSSDVAESVYGEDGSCWSDFPAAECWRQCEEALSGASLVLPEEPACWGCASDDDCEGETPYCSYRHTCLPTPDFCGDYCGQLDTCCENAFSCDGVSIMDVPSCVEGCEQTLAEADATPCGALRRQAMECAGELSCGGFEDWIPAWFACRDPEASCPGYDDCTAISQAYGECVG